MTFDEIELYSAIEKVWQKVEDAGSDKWVHEKRDDLCRMIQKEMPVEPLHWINAWLRFRKSTLVKPGGMKKYQLLLRVAKKSNGICFWSGRVDGDCGGDMSIDRIIPGSKGGQYTIANCILACKKHNSQRGDQTIEEYLAQNKD